PPSDRCSLRRGKRPSLGSPMGVANAGGNGLLDGWAGAGRDDLTAWGQRTWRIAVRIPGNALEYRPMHAATDAARRTQRLGVPRLPGVQLSEARGRVVELAVHVRGSPVQLPLFGDEAQRVWQLARLRLRHHPVERHERHALVRIAASDVGMDTREPDLLDPRIARIICTRDGIASVAGVRLRPFAPE